MSRTSLQTDRQVRDLARRITSLGLQSVAVFLLEAGRPVALLAAQLVWLAQPVLALGWKPHQLAQWAQFLEEPGSVESLLSYFDSEE